MKRLSSGWVTLCSTTRLPADLGYIAIREAGDGYAHIGDIFGFDERPDMEEAAANHGPPIAACISVATGGTVHEYCAPLAQASD